jgi:Tfp pilus assembly protein PilF
VLILLLTTLLSVQTPDPHAEAERLARTGDYSEALERFRSLAAVNPEDLDARIWIARLHVIMGNFRQGEEVYRSVMLDGSDRVDVLVGLGSTLVAEGHLDQAREVLGRAERIAPNDLELLAAQGSLNLAANRPRLAAGYYGRARLMAPEQNDLRLNFEEARRRYDHRFEATYFNEQFSDTTPASHSGELSVNFRANDSIRITGRGQQERRFAVTDMRGGGGLEWRIGRPRLLSLQAYGLAGPGNTILPQGEAGATLGWIRGATTITLSARYFGFDRARMRAAGPAVRVDVTDTAWFSMSFTRASSDFDGFADAIGESSGDLRVGVRVQPRLWLEGAYARGIENFDRVTIDRLGRFPANTVSGTARLSLRSLTTVAATYEYQSIEGGIKMGRLTARVIQSF